MNQKKILSLTLVVLLIAIISIGTLAWFTDKKSITNTFYIASSDDTDPDDIFSVSVYEEVDTDGDSIVDQVVNNGAVFNNVLPGKKIVKAPYVKNTGKYEQWIRLTITFAPQDAWHTIFNSTAEGPLALLNLSDDFDDHWIDESYNTTGKEYVYVYYAKNPLAPGDILKTFTDLTLPQQLTQEDMFGIQDLTLKVTAEAVQTKNLGDDVDTAAEAFSIIELRAPSAD